MEAHHHSIPETVVVDVRTVVEIHILQVEKAEADMTVVLSEEVGIRAPADKGSAVVVVVVALGVDTGYGEAEVAGENTSSAAAENMRSAEAAGWKSRTAS